MGLIEKLLTEAAPDILCLQEIKCESHLFPAEALAAPGYTHQAVSGQKGYHGVATVSRVPIREVTRHDWQDNGEARHIGVEVLGKNLLIENVYVPAGGDVPDRAVNPKFGQKLDFLGRMTKWADRLDRPTLIVGDFNIAPLESDVWSHKQLLKVVSHTPIEVETLGRFQDAHGWVDLGRQHVPAPARYYSGGAIAIRAGRRTTRGGGLTICGPRPRWLARRGRTACWRMRAAGRSHPITCR